MISSTSCNSYLSSYYLNSLANSASTSSTSSGTSSQTAKSSETADQFTLSNALQQLIGMLGSMGNSRSQGALSESEGANRQQGPPQSGMPPQGPPPSGKPGEDFAQAIEEKQAEFNSELMAKLEAAGIDTTQDITLAFDDEGKIVVTSDVGAEDKAVIESILADDVDLIAGYKELADLTEFAAEMEARFSQGPSPSDMEGIQNMFSGATGLGMASSSNVASAYAANSNLQANSTNSLALLQQLVQMLGT